jgi:superfamily II DNA or RNA helicase
MGVNRQIVRWPTGLGKTVLFSALPEHLKLGGRMLVLVHREELAQQAVDKLKRWNPRLTVGIEMASSHAHDSDIVVASVQTLGVKNSKRLASIDPGEFHILVTDECHHAVAETYRRIYKHFDIFERKALMCLGVTATPKRADGIGVGAIFEEIVHDVPMIDAINQGYLSDLTGYRIVTGTSLDKVRTLAGDFSPSQLTGAVNTPGRNRLVVKQWLARALNRQTITFAVDIAHAGALAQAFRDHDIAAEAVWGNDPERQRKLAQHKRKQLRVLVNCQVLTEGYDDWQVSCICMARPTKSEGLYTQMIGRGTRIQDGIESLVRARELKTPVLKEDCLVLDFVDSTRQHSLVTLATLIGLDPNLDLEGRSITKVKRKIEELSKKYPQADFSKVTDLDELHAYVEEVAFFEQDAEVIIKTFSPFDWRNVGGIAKDTYLLMLPDGEGVRICKEAECWAVIGTVCTYPLRASRRLLREAVIAADEALRRIAPSDVIDVLKQARTIRTTRPDHQLPPTDYQQMVCRQHGISIPDGITRSNLQVIISKRILGGSLPTK